MDNDNVEINQIGEHEYEVIDYDNETYETVMPRRHCNFFEPKYVFLFKPSKNPRVKTKVVLKKTTYPLISKVRLVCEDGKQRLVSVVGNFCVAGNVFNQRGESLGPNNHDYYIKKIGFEIDKSNYDVRFTDVDFANAQAYNARLNK